MAQYPNSGALFTNKNKTATNNQPVMRGNVDLQCPHCNKEYKKDVSAWNKFSDKAGEWLSLSFQKPWVKSEDAAQESQTTSSSTGNDGMPF